MNPHGWAQPGNPWAYYPQYGPPPPGAAPPVPGPPGQPQAPYGGYWGQAGWAPPTATNAGYSAKYPTLNPVLASDTTQVRYDVRRKAKSDIPGHIYAPNRGLFATSSSASHIRLISKAFPWSVEVKSGVPITVEGIWDAIHTALQQHIADSEWGIIISDKKLREAIEKAAKKRSETDADPLLKRVDWLGTQTVFKGLDKFEEFTEMRLLPGMEPCTETWVVKLGPAGWIDCYRQRGVLIVLYLSLYIPTVSTFRTALRAPDQLNSADQQSGKLFAIDHHLGFAMVSFSCHACQDTVKKPKLDSHYARCGTGFDCIDCSKSFHSPAEFRTHTSCVTEAEKYEKSVYKGVRTPGFNKYASYNNNSNSGRGGYSGSRGGRGGAFNGGGGGRWGVRSPATGGNELPLGAPNRMSPPTPVIAPSPPAVAEKPATAELSKEDLKKAKAEKKAAKEEKKAAKAAEREAKKEKKREKKETAAEIAPPAAEPFSKKRKRDEVDDAAPPAAEKNKKDKKSKKSAAPVEDAPAPTDSAVALSSSKKRKRDDSEVVLPVEEKKEKKDKKAKAEAADVPMPVDDGGAVDDKAERKRRKKEAKAAAAAAGENGPTESDAVNGKKGKRKDAEGESETKPKKSKKSKTTEVDS
ncbi:C2H2-type domain-containing protein [Mycena chlorophos]|uniref:C2H2-type domain-containing protein n=1 Tax=Mycena chlorophos TaxID=658473 RepID=A0A8H6SUZ0_MYCCL|nr:C2H2-type domain-containing protein [Mycena chlorophos]